MDFLRVPNMVDPSLFEQLRARSGRGVAVHCRFGWGTSKRAEEVHAFEGGSSVRRSSFVRSVRRSVFCRSVGCWSVVCRSSAVRRSVGGGVAARCARPPSPP